MEPTNNCRHCGTALQGAFCSHCGQKHLTERFTAKGFFLSFLATITNLESGFWHTMKMLFLRPGRVIANYTSGNIKPYYPPLRYTFIIIGLSVLINLSLGSFELTSSGITDAINPGLDEEGRAASKRTQEALTPFLNFIPLFLLPFIGYFTYRFFRKKNYNYGEHLILNTYTMGQTTVIGLPFVTSLTLGTGIPWYGLGLSVLIWSGYQAVLFKRLFKTGWVRGFLQSLVSYLLGYMGFMVFVGVISVIIVVGRVLVGIVFGFR